MKNIHYSNTESKKYNAETVKGVTGRVLIGKADGAPNFCMRMFELSSGGFTPRHSHEWEHEIFFHAGTGEVFSDEKWSPVESGHAVFIPGDSEHQIRNTGSDPLIFVCLIPSGVPEL